MPPLTGIFFFLGNVSTFLPNSFFSLSPPFFSGIGLVIFPFHHSLPPSLTLFSLSLPQDPKERLGCHPQTGFADIMGHPFFRNVDWELVSDSISSSAFLSQFFQMKEISIGACWIGQNKSIQSIAGEKGEKNKSCRETAEGQI